MYVHTLFSFSTAFCAAALWVPWQQRTVE